MGVSFFFLSELCSDIDPFGQKLKCINENPGIKMEEQENLGNCGAWYMWKNV